MPSVHDNTMDTTANCEEGTSLQDLAETSGFGIAFGCGSGTCGTCLINITSDKASVSPMTEQEEFTLEAFGLETDGSQRLACQCKVMGDLSFES